jgi:hypothetical protein
MAEYNVDLRVSAIIEGRTIAGEEYCSPTDERVIPLHVEWTFCTPYPEGCCSVISNRVNRSSSCSSP